MSIFGTIVDKIFHSAPTVNQGKGGPGIQESPAVSQQHASNASALQQGSASQPSMQQQASAPQAAQPQGQTVATAGSRQSLPPQSVDVEATLNAMASKNSQQLNWRTSIVDLMKLMGLDSSLDARKRLASELNYTGDMNDSAAMNIWLHREVMKRLAENGGKVPPDLIRH